MKAAAVAETSTKKERLLVQVPVLTIKWFLLGWVTVWRQVNRLDITNCKLNLVYRPSGK